MASKQIGINITGKNNASNALKGAAKDIDGLKKSAGSAGSTINSSMGKAGSNIGQSISKGANTASQSVQFASTRMNTALKSTEQSGNRVSNALKSGFNKAGSGINKSISIGTRTASQALGGLKNSASSVWGSLKAGAGGVKQSIGDLGSAVGGLLGGFTALQAATMAWTGSTQREFNEMYLRTKMAGSAADNYLDIIQDVVAQVPGDDTWMNSLLTGALARQTSLSADQLKRLGTVASKYIIAAQQTGAAVVPENAERELTAYIKTGNTGLMVRDGILKSHVDELNKAKTPAERIVALEKAMTDEGYMQMDMAALTSSKWDEIKGRIQLAATTVGDKLLPYVEKVLDWIIKLDEDTDGWATTIGFVGVALAGLGLALAPVVGATLSGYYAMKNYRIEAEKAAAANGLNKGPGGKPYYGPGGGPSAREGFLGSGVGLATFLGKYALPGVAAGIAGGFGLQQMSGTIGQKQVDTTVSAVNTGPTGLASGLSMLMGQFLGGKKIDPNKVFNEMMTSMFSPLNVLKTSMGSWSKITDDINKVFGTDFKWPSMDDVIGVIKDNFPKIMDFKWPTPMDTFLFIKSKFPKLPPLKWPTIGQLFSFIKGKVPKIPGLKWPSIGSILSYIKRIMPRIPSLRWPSPGTIGSWVRSKIRALNSLRWPSWGDIKGWIISKINNQRSVNVGVGGPGGPRGPGPISTARGINYNGLSLNYENYPGHEKNPFTAAGCMSGNCVDMSLGLMALNGGRGDIIGGTWNGNPHVWYKTPSGMHMDPARKAINNTWNPPARGPNGNSGTTIMIRNEFKAPVYGVDDLDKRITRKTRDGVKQAINGRAGITGGY
jgi:uncharacterized protein YukE